MPPPPQPPWTPTITATCGAAKRSPACAFPHQKSAPCRGRGRKPTRPRHHRRHAAAQHERRRNHHHKECRRAAAPSPYATRPRRSASGVRASCGTHACCGARIEVAPRRRARRAAAAAHGAGRARGAAADALRGAPAAHPTARGACRTHRVAVGLRAAAARRPRDGRRAPTTTATEAPRRGAPARGAAWREAKQASRTERLTRRAQCGTA